MEISMKTILLTGVAAALLITAQTALAQPARAPICLPTRNIAQTSPSPDGRAITFRMTDGSVWRNDLRGRCPDLRWSGFSWATSDPMERVCENEQTISVIRSAEVCALGNFTQLEPAGQHNFASGER
jgi:hypothetical protein